MSADAPQSVEENLCSRRASKLLSRVSNFISGSSANTSAMLKTSKRGKLVDIDNGCIAPAPDSCRRCCSQDGLAVGLASREWPCWKRAAPHIPVPTLRWLAEAASMAAAATGTRGVEAVGLVEEAAAAAAAAAAALSASASASASALCCLNSFLSASFSASTARNPCEMMALSSSSSVSPTPTLSSNRKSTRPVRRCPSCLMSTLTRLAFLSACAQLHEPTLLISPESRAITRSPPPFVHSQFPPDSLDPLLLSSE
mmetsp:Transcript_19559/g.48377  ORF Transcript_19559/g.48377 Transcript_19559/m.48377 type:complete len:256 (-) Transcript_19559:737-1504(-)